MNSPIVVINVSEYKNAEAYDHLCGLMVGWTPVCWIFEDFTSRNNMSWKTKTEKNLNNSMEKYLCTWMIGMIHIELYTHIYTAGVYKGKCSKTIRTSCMRVAFLCNLKCSPESQMRKAPNYENK